ncbi:MAG: ADP-ribosylglycohydrolase family protein [Planctomycetes bacterium]|nr:ADP-ribosylglycohydrolase family protein [Planctomycetota bacterium]
MTRAVHADRLRGALWGMFIGDALAMPAHWYYDVAALQRDFGTLRDYLPPTDYHPNSIMSLSSTGTSGRGSQQGEVVGSVILHGKKHLWGQPNRHYHYGLQSGDNTLNLLCVRVLLRTMNGTGRYDSGDFLASYVAFMTTPDSHNDTYAESYHRDFFANYARGISPERCAGREGHDTASIGGLVALPPVIAAALRENDPAAVDRMPLEHLRLTHRSAKLERYARALGGLLVRFLLDADPPVQSLVCATAGSLGFAAAKVVERMNRDRRPDLDVIGGMLSPACYIEHSFPAVLYLAARYPDDFEAALAANANAGGDNCHRGAVLGAILGAALGYRAIPDRWIYGLRSRAALSEEVECFIARFA